MHYWWQHCVQTNCASLLFFCACVVVASAGVIVSAATENIINLHFFSPTRVVQQKNAIHQHIHAECGFTRRSHLWKAINRLQTLSQHSDKTLAHVPPKMALHSGHALEKVPLTTFTPKSSEHFEQLKPIRKQWSSNKTGRGITNDTTSLRKVRTMIDCAKFAKLRRKKTEPGLCLLQNVRFPLCSTPPHFPLTTIKLCK